jgi:hypothetical protein
LVTKKGDEMSKAKKESKKIEDKPSDIDKIRNRINELYVILEGMSSRLDDIEKVANRAAHRLGI